MSMTRINSSINVKLLTDEHLLAEHREIKRLPAVYKKHIERSESFSKLPNEFVLGAGHVLFFINKGQFTLARYLELYTECLNRGFKVEDYSQNWLCYNILNDYIPTDKENTLLIERITDRLLKTKKNYWHYYGKQITKEEAVNLLTKK